MEKLFTPFDKNGLKLKNHIVMAPMTRSRALDNIPNQLMATYYGQRSEAGLIITEATAINPDALGYTRIPGIFNQQQIAGWKLSTDAVHASGSKIFLQLVHSGRIGHVDNLPVGAKLVGVSDIRASGQIYTDTRQMQDFSQPKALSTAEVETVIEDCVTAARNAIQAGFDGVELHSANGYLMEQFLNPHINNRTDRFGGSIENRARFLLTVAAKISAAIGRSNVGVRFSPYSTFNDLPAYEPQQVHETYQYLADKLNEIGICYIHLALNPDADKATYEAVREKFTGNLLYCNGLDMQSAEKILEGGSADLVGFGRHFIANPDLVTRLQQKAALQQPDFTTFYAAGEQGYIDYSFLS
ncbi:alkene reductase [Arachidicoccus ginsenosidivorans]|uniref:Alkene reductase n=1 Tax=Arachidicoccus ginsenosidivorans TaxID=496057 RepID=A0A5B8VHK0_9BACT|nr:alkene reductase [Arachidicoccus ginsenosidivorans]QEC71014.1 alkene reductase [Arachidicoccus ginsenosidivorans]